MGYRSERARQEKCTAAQMLRNKFREAGVGGGVSAQYVRFGTAPVVIGVSGLKFDSMLISVIAEDNEVFAKLSECASEGYSVLFVNGDGKVTAKDSMLIQRFVINLEKLDNNITPCQR